MIVKTGFEIFNVCMIVPVILFSISWAATVLRLDALSLLILLFRLRHNLDLGASLYTLTECPEPDTAVVVALQLHSTIHSTLCRYIYCI